MRLSRKALYDLLKEHNFNVVGAVGDGHELLEAARRLKPDLICRPTCRCPG